MTTAPTEQREKTVLPACAEQYVSTSLRSSDFRSWVTLAIIAVNVAVFVAMVAVTKQVVNFDLQVLLACGANFGPLTTSGQWWRLLTAVFLHVGLLHVAFNMWALWHFGRQTERLFGWPAFLFKIGRAHV